jgi:hypothetical protein
MCFKQDFVASRPAKVGDKLVTTKFKNSVTGGFAAVEEPTVAVCVLPGTEIAFEQELEYCHSLLPNHQGRREVSSVPADRLGTGVCAPRRARVSQRKDHSARPTVRRPARDCAAVAGFSARHERSGAEQSSRSAVLSLPDRAAPPGCRSDRDIKERSGCRWLFHYPRAATEPHCRGRYLGPMNHSVEGNSG